MTILTLTVWRFWDGIRDLFITADPTLLGAFAAAIEGSAYGLFVGWIVGIAVVSAKGGD